MQFLCASLWWCRRWVFNFETVWYTTPQVENVHWYLKFSKVDVVGRGTSPNCFLEKVYQFSSVQDHWIHICKLVSADQWDKDQSATDQPTFITGAIVQVPVCDEKNLNICKNWQLWFSKTFSELNNCIHDLKNDLKKFIAVWNVDLCPIDIPGEFTDVVPTWFTPKFGYWDIADRGVLILDPGSEIRFFPSRIPEPWLKKSRIRIRIKEIKYFLPKGRY